MLEPSLSLIERAAASAVLTLEATKITAAMMDNKRRMNGPSWESAVT
jgi:hypothetical protein